MDASALVCVHWFHVVSARSSTTCHPRVTRVMRSYVAAARCGRVWLPALRSSLTAGAGAHQLMEDNVHEARIPWRRGRRGGFGGAR